MEMLRTPQRRPSPWAPSKRGQYPISHYPILREFRCGTVLEAESRSRQTAVGEQLPDARLNFADV